MSLNYVNPGHPVSQFMMDSDNEIPLKLLAVAAFMNGGTLVIDHEAVKEFMAQPKKFLITHFHAESVELKIVTLEEGERIAREAGGMAS